MSSDPAVALAALLDGLIPGDDLRWPPFSAAVAVPAFADGLDPILHDQVTAFCDRHIGTPMADVPAEIAAWEQAAPREFAALLSAAYRAYYTSPLVLGAVTALADAGPREPSALFDPDLVARVVATGAGRRRL